MATIAEYLPNDKYINFVYCRICSQKYRVYKTLWRRQIHKRHPNSVKIINNKLNYSKWDWQWEWHQKHCRGNLNDRF